MFKIFKYLLFSLLLVIAILFIFKKNSIYIPYQDECGQPSKELVKITINQLEKVKKLKYIYFQEKLFNKNRFYFSKAYKVFDENILSKYQISKDDFTYKQNNKIYNIFNRTFYELEVSTSNKSTNYLGFWFKYKNTFCKGLQTNYVLFYDHKKELEHKIEDYTYIKKLEDNWYFMVKTTIDTNSDIFNNTFISKDTNKRWEDITPPLNFIIKPYDFDLINQWI